MEAHDGELRVQERAVVREDAWRRRVDQRALALDPPAWLLAELGPVPADPQERAVWRVAAAELDGFRRAYGLDHPGSAEHVGGRVAQDRRPAAPATRPATRAGGTGEQRERRGRDQRAPHRGDRQRHRADPGRLLGDQPRRDTPGRRRDWQVARAALEHLAGWGRHRDHRHPHRERPIRHLGREERDGR
jgi:hypothetical protein